MKTVKSIGVLIAVIVVVFAIQGCVKVESGSIIENSVPTISVQGTGKVVAEPDEAVAWFGVTIDEKTLSRAYRKNTDSMNAVITAVKSMGVDEKDIKTSSYNVTPMYPRDENGRQVPGKPVSFKVSQQLTVKVRDLLKLGDVIDKVIAEGTNSFEGINFSSSKIEDLRAQAKVEAAKDAKNKAFLLAESLGVRLGRLLKAGQSQQPMYEARNVMAFSAKAMDSSLQIASGSMEVNDICNVVYEIEQ